MASPAATTEGGPHNEPYTKLLHFVDVASSGIQRALSRPTCSRRKVNHRKFIARILSTERDVHRPTASLSLSGLLTRRFVAGKTALYRRDKTTISAPYLSTRSGRSAVDARPSVGRLYQRSSNNDDSGFVADGLQIASGETGWIEHDVTEDVGLQTVPQRHESWYDPSGLCSRSESELQHFPPTGPSVNDDICQIMCCQSSSCNVGGTDKQLDLDLLHCWTPCRIENTCGYSAEDYFDLPDLGDDCCPSVEEILEVCDMMEETEDRRNAVCMSSSQFALSPTATTLLP